MTDVQAPAAARCFHCGMSLHPSALNEGQWVHDDQWAWESDPHPVMLAPEKIVVPDFYRDDRGTKRSIKLDEQGVPRDQWGRPVIRRADGTWRGYSRISSIAKELDAGIGLTYWKTAMTAIGITITPDLFVQVARLVDDAVSDPYAENRSALIKLAEKAQEAAGSTIKRELGTTLHEWAAIWDRTHDLDLIPAEHRADIEAYALALGRHHVAVLENEVFVVVDEIEIAGSLDKLLQFQMPTGRVVLGDLKTGQVEPQYPMNVEMQVAGYVHGERYDLLSHERSSLHPDLDLDEGMLIHLPSRSGTCEIYPLNLKRGWQNLMLATDLKRARRESGRRLKPLESAA